MVRPRVCKTDLVQIPIAADSLFDPLRALTVFRTLFTHRSNLEEIRLLITHRLEFLRVPPRRGPSFVSSAMSCIFFRNSYTSSSQAAMSSRSSATSLFETDGLTYIDLGNDLGGSTGAGGATTGATTGGGTTGTDLRFFDLTFRVLFGLTASTGATAGATTGGTTGATAGATTGGGTTGATMGEIAGGGGATTGGTTGGGITFAFRVFLGFEFTFRVLLTLTGGITAGGITELDTNARGMISRRRTEKSPSFCAAIRTNADKNLSTASLVIRLSYSEVPINANVSHDRVRIICSFFFPGFVV